MTMTTLLEHFYSIPDNSYTTGSEWADGLIIGLATLLLIRNAELIILDVLTFFFGDRPRRVGYRVLRTWQMLTLNHFLNLVTGYDNDIPRSRLRKAMTVKRDVFPNAKLKITKGKFATLLFVFVFLGKLIVLSAEVAIIALVIPGATMHRSSGGLGFKWKNTTITEESLAAMPTCLQLFSSQKLTDTAQLALCKRAAVLEGTSALAAKWIPKGSLRLERAYLSREVAEKGGGTVRDNLVVSCELANPGRTSGILRAYINHTRRQLGVGDGPRALFVNDVDIGELAVSGIFVKSDNGSFLSGEGGIQPVFSDTEETLRLSLPNFMDGHVATIGGMVPLLNDKLLFADSLSAIEGRRTRDFCAHSLNEIIRVSGTLSPDLLIDIIRSSMAPAIQDNFTQPSADFDVLNPAKGFQIGISRRFRVPPEWMAGVAAMTVLLSMLTSHLNKTESRMARVYRENNNMLGACSPVYLDKEVAVGGALFQKGEEYHWGADPGQDWEGRDAFDFSGNVILL